MSERPRYGDNRRAWHPDFLEYMYDIVEHPNFAGMPCTVDDDGKIDWTIPSNRTRGSKNWDGNSRRREWWREKAKELGIATKGKWLSKTAKSIHPTGKKPCQICGRVMELAYVYPTKRSVETFNKYLPPDETLTYEDLLTVYEVIDHFFTVLGHEQARGALTRCLKKETPVGSPDEVKEFVRQEFVERESRRFSPGAMSNAPDRLDGYHTYNLCCRSRQDTGRSKDNLRTYSDDRRAFEHWCEGDWVAANYLMTRTTVGNCSSPTCENSGPLTADHIGPISLGFAHSPDFITLCRACNSAKNNRMSLSDVEMLRIREGRGEKVASWQIRSLWDRCKGSVKSDADALLLSKLLRILQHHYIMHLYEILKAGAPDALMQFLDPQQALSKVEFIGLDRNSLDFEEIKRVKRNDTYAHSKAARMIRIAFDALGDYAQKENRNVQAVESEHVDEALERFRESVKRAATEPSMLREGLIAVLELDGSPELRAAELRRLLAGRYSPDVDYDDVREALGELLDAYSEVLASRYGRGEAVGWDD